MNRIKWNWRALLSAVLALTMIRSCAGNHDTPDDTGSAKVVAQALSPLDGYSVTVAVTGGSLPSPRTVTLAGGATHYETTIGGLPVGTGYTFTALTADAHGTILYKGNAIADIAKDQTTSLLITLLQATPSTPYANAAPVIDSLVISSTLVAPGDSA